MKKQSNNKNEWKGKEINIQGIINNNQKDITSFYENIKPWLLFITKNNEEYTNDIFIKIITKLPLFDENRGKLYNFIYTLSLNEYKVKMRPVKQSIIIVDTLYNVFGIKSEYTNIPDLINNENDSYLTKLEELPQEDIEFLYDYITKKYNKAGDNFKKFKKLKEELNK